MFKLIALETNKNSLYIVLPETLRKTIRIIFTYRLSKGSLQKHLEWERLVVRKLQQKKYGPTKETPGTTAFLKNRMSSGLKEYTCFCYKAFPGQGRVGYIFSTGITGYDISS